MIYDLFNPPPSPAPAPPRPVVGTIKPRWCQGEDSDALMHAIETTGKKRFSWVAATGYGKSVVLSENVGRLRDAGKAVVLVDRRVLAYQIAKTLERHLGSDVGFVADKVCTGLERQVVVSTVQAMYTQDRQGRRLHDYPQFSKVASVHPDESHGFFAQEASTVLGHYVNQCGAVVCGSTATPSAASGADWNSFYEWNAQAEGPCMRTTRWCREAGLVVPLRQAFVKANLRSDQLAGMNGGDDDALAKTLVDLLTDRNERRGAEFAKGIAEVIGRRQALIFAPAVQHGELGQATAAKLIASWLGNLLPCEPVWSGRVDADDAVSRFESGRLQALTNVNLLGTGYDNPAISAVFLCRNLSQWRTVQQYVGRAVRPSASIVGELVRFDGPENSAKRRAIIAASDKPDALIADLIGLDDKVIHASAIDVLYADESDEVRQQMAEDASRRQRQPQVGERDEIDDAARDAAKAEIARQQNDRLAALARQRAMAGDLPADVHVSYSGHSTVAPEIPTGRAVGTVGERARFVALSVAKYPDVHAARAIAEKMDRNQLRGMTAAVDRELRKQGARPDWRRADAAYPEYAASHGRKAPPMPPPQPRPAPKPQPTAVLPDGRTIWEF